MSAPTNIETTTAVGLHDYVIEQIVSRYFRPGERAVDLGSGPGALVERLSAAGWHVLATDINAEVYRADVPFLQIDFNQNDFASQIGVGEFGLVTSVEVIEHVESPIGFLRNIGRLLKPGGVAVITTPNVDSTPARVKFLLSGTIRMMDANGEPTHTTPIFWDLFNRQYLPRAGVELLEHHSYPARGYQMTRPMFAHAMGLVSWALRGKECLYGDNNVFVLTAGKDRRQKNTR